VPTVEQNRAMWDRDYAWPDDGDEWSSGWGGPELQWYRWLYPRLLAAVPDLARRRVVEIGCGRGRWTQFLLRHCAEVTAVDLAPGCVEHCRRRFAGTPGLRALEVDGSSLVGVPDRSVDLVVSIDSLVHADRAVMAGYVAECARVLSTDGVAVLHHSNLGAHPLDRHPLLRRVRGMRRRLAALRLAEPSVHWRDATVSADLVEELAAANGLRCTTQELLRWSTRRAAIDCISVLVRASAPADGAPHRFYTTTFQREMTESIELARAYRRWRG
jgi:SAM-dependent methyltransferase